MGRRCALSLHMLLQGFLVPLAARARRMVIIILMHDCDPFERHAAPVDPVQQHIHGLFSKAVFVDSHARYGDGPYIPGIVVERYDRNVFRHAHLQKAAGTHDQLDDRIVLT